VAPIETSVAEAPVVGDVVPAGTELPKGQQTYEMSDGSYVVISADDAVPDAVLADVQAITAQYNAPDAPGAGGVNRGEKIRVLHSKLKNTKVVAIVTSVALLSEELYTGADPSTVYALVVNGELEGTVSHSEADVLAAADDYIASNGGLQSGWKVLRLY
jgi:hypothetical protein